MQTRGWSGVWEKTTTRCRALFPMCFDVVVEEKTLDRVTIDVLDAKRSMNQHPSATHTDRPVRRLQHPGQPRQLLWAHAPAKLHKPLVEPAQIQRRVLVLVRIPSQRCLRQRPLLAPCRGSQDGDVVGVEADEEEAGVGGKGLVGRGAAGVEGLPPVAPVGVVVEFVVACLC